MADTTTMHRHSLRPLDAVNRRAAPARRNRAGWAEATRLWHGGTMRRVAGAGRYPSATIKMSGPALPR
jgi:hypothetical protein